MRERGASSRARCRWSPNTEVLGIDVERGRVRARAHDRAATSRPRRRRSRAASGARAWRAMAGAHDPAHPRRAPDDRRRARAAVRRRDEARSSSRSCATWTRSCTSARTAVGLEIGSYAHRPILHDPEDIPSIEEAALSPTEFPFTQDDFEQQMEHALELMPEIVGDERSA